MNWFYNTILFLARSYLRLFYGKKVYGLEHFVPGGVLLAANHASFYDPPVVSTSWPQPVHFMARESLFKNKFFGALIRSLCTHPVRGGAADAKVFRLICDLLTQGNAVLLFPEGQRTENGELGEVKPGIFLLVSRTSVPIVPVYVHGTYQVWSRFRKFPKFSGTIACVFGTPIDWKSFSHLEKREAEKAICQKIKDSWVELKDWYLKGAKGTPP